MKDIDMLYGKLYCRYMRVIWSLTFFLLLLVIPIVAHSAIDGNYTKLFNRRFTVRDSIEMSEPVDPRGRAFMENPQMSLFSPDGKKVLILTRQGDLDSGKNYYKITLFYTKEILNYIRGPVNAKKPIGHVLYILGSSDYAYVYDDILSMGIQKIRWLDDSQRITFLGKDENNFNQIYLHDLRTSKTDRLTNVGIFIEDYDLAIDKGIAVVIAREKRKCNIAFPFPEKIGDGSYIEHIGLCGHADLEFNWPYSELGLFKIELDGGDKATRVPSRLAYSNMGYLLTIAPNGKRVAYASGIAVDPSSPWKIHFNHTKKGQNYWRFVAGGERNNLSGRPFPMLRQVQIANIDANKSESLIDAPLVFGEKFAGLLWLPDSNRLIVSGTHLPNSGKMGADLIRKAHIVEIDVTKRSFRRIYEYETAYSDVFPTAFQFAGAELFGGRYLLVQRMKTGRISDEPDIESSILFRVVGDEWLQVPLSELHTYFPLRARVSVYTKEDFNNPPDYYARELGHENSVRLTVLNPRFENVEQPIIEYLSWKGSHGELWSGGLLLPPDFDKSRTYPLVIQIGEQDEGRFIRDGAETAFTAPFAGRALASHGVAVLNMAAYSKDNFSVIQMDEAVGAGRHFSDGVEAAIDMLIKRGIHVDKERIGLVGFSHGGRTALNALVQSNINFRAAVIADAAPVGPLAYYLSAGWTYDLSGMIEKFVQGYPWGDGLANWNQNNPVMKLDRVKAAIRIENYWRPAAIVWYDVYTIMKRLGKAVEYYTYDGATHLPRNPIQRFSSQGGTVDWMLFWLKGEKPKSKEKSELYMKWERLKSKDEYAAGLTGANP